MSLTFFPPLLSSQPTTWLVAQCSLQYHESKLILETRSIPQLCAAIFKVERNADDFDQRPTTYVRIPYCLIYRTLAQLCVLA